MPTVPKINRIEPTGRLPQNARINIQAKDQASSILGRTEAIVNVAEAGADIYQQYEDDTIDSLANQNEIEFKAWAREEQRKLKDVTGDPTEAYNDYDRRANEKYKELIDRNQGASDRVKRHVASRLDKVYANDRVESGYQSGAQKEVFDNNLYEATVKNKRDGLAVNAGYVRRDDPSSFFMFDQGINDIKTLVAKQGLKKGNVKVLPQDAKTYSHTFMDDEGNIVKVQMDEIAKGRVAKELSQGVKDSIDAMIASGNVEEARLMQQRYGAFLDSKNKAKIDNKFQTTDRKNEAYRFLAGMRGQSDQEKLDKINNLSDGELRSEILKIKEADDSRIARQRERRNNENADTMLKEINRLRDAGTPISTMGDLENNSVFKAIQWDELDAKAQAQVREAIKAPKDSNEKSLKKVQSLFLGDADVDLGSIEREEFEREYLSGLNAKDRKFWENRYNKLKSPSMAQERAVYTRAGNLLQDQLIQNEHIQRNDYGQIRDDDEITLLKAKEELANHMAKYGTFKTDAELQQFVKDYSASLIKGKVFNPPQRTIKKPSSNQGVTQASAPGRTTGADSTIVNNLSAMDRLRYKAAYSRKYNTATPLNTDARFIEFVNSNPNLN